MLAEAIQSSIERLSNLHLERELSLADLLYVDLAVLEREDELAQVLPEAFFVGEESLVGHQVHYLL